MRALVERLDVRADLLPTPSIFSSDGGDFLVWLPWGLGPNSAPPAAALSSLMSGVCVVLGALEHPLLSYSVQVQR